ncbi:hypothetical protein Q5425_21155 [Amycolatopsis sp. A133]|uniref:hypothetical protein n=1 Tax=Amycolatopsis sp. A133 TaxID=3064472 RepID=UPI0027FA67CD|nr:hypothetical protein [Amycolatopsis sp. A133]MDQ7806259.1 hypothetical protein [Amycolatopsis sp. A133]
MRSASATWTVIADLVADTVAQSSALLRDEAVQAMAVAEAAGRMLIAGGHLHKHPITLVAGKVYCEITTVSGTAALALEENLNPVPGAAGADAFMIYLPSPAPLQQQVKEAANAHARLSDGSPPTEQTKAASSGPLIDREALRQAVTQR